MITRPSNRFRQGTWFECFDDGCRKVEITSKNNRVKVTRELGLVLPFSEIEDYVITAMRKGLNTYKIKSARRGG